MDWLSVGLLVTYLVLLIMLSAFFSGSEIGMMSLNRYRLRHLVQQKKPGAARVQELITKPERLLGVILIGNTFANILASAVATILAVRLWGEVGVAIATIALTLIILIFAEIMPKTTAAIYPQKVAFIVAWPLNMLLYLLSPLVWLANTVASGILRLFGINLRRRRADQLSQEELRTLLRETGALISAEYKSMLLSVLDLERVTVEDIMIPRNEIVGIDLSEPWDDILTQLETSQHTRLPIYQRDIDQVEGFIHLRDVLKLMTEQTLTKESLLEVAEACYFIPEATPLHVQLVQFQQHKQRSCLVVDEYGDIQGLVTLEDILEEIVGEFTTNITNVHRDIVPQVGGSVVVDGGITLRELNRQMRWRLPQTGPKTLSGLVIDSLEFIPPVGTCLRIAGYVIEVKQVKGNMVKTVEVTPPEAL
jgi:Mg2+/Co2+ transporter CorB